MVFAYLHLFGGLGYQIKRVYAVGILYPFIYKAGAAQHDLPPKNNSLRQFNPKNCIFSGFIGAKFWGDGHM